MYFSFINVAMLLGLATVVLPIIAHLLSKRRYDVVNWGAMQFLQLGQKTRRRIRIQDLLLLLLRMALLACLTFALARPYGTGTFFSKFTKSVSRDVVFIVDGSGSLGWTGETTTPHTDAILWVHQAMEDLHPGDTVGLIDARSRNRRLIHPPTSNLSRVRKALDEIPEPTGTSNLVEAVLEASRILATTSNVTREIIVLTDQQSYPWQIDDEFALQRIDDSLKQFAVRPTISVVSLTKDDQPRNNFSVGKIELSRAMTVPGFPIRFRSTIKQSGGSVKTKKVSLAINGQLTPDAQRTVNVLPDGEALVEFEHTFSTTGFFRVTLSIEPDNLPQDDFAEAIIVVQNGIPVLLVDGDSHIDETQTETFFLKSAFAASGNEHPWIRSRVIPPEQLNEAALKEVSVVMLCNVESITREQHSALLEFLYDGGGVIFAPGEKTNPARWNELRIEKEIPFLPATLEKIETEDPDVETIQSIESLSLESAWLQRFRKESGVDFWIARFSKWWSLQIPPHDDSADAESEDLPVDSVIARFSDGKPFMISRRVGEGTLLQMAVPLDADWSTLPARSDFVPFVHEMVFQLTDSATENNVEVGMPIQIELAEDERPKDFVVTGPGIKNETPQPARDGRKSLASFTDTTIPGIYWFAKKNAPQAVSIPFVVNDNRAESDLTPLDELGWETLATDDRMQQIEKMAELTTRIQSENSSMELWWLLLLFLLIILTCEVAMTRNMLKQGHTDLEAIAGGE